MNTIQVGNVGETITINLGITLIPLSTVIRVIVETPIFAYIEWILGVGELDRTTGIITHVTKTGEILIPGEYKVQVWKTSTGVVIYSTVDTFKAYDNLGTPPVVSP